MTRPGGCFDAGLALAIDDACSAYGDWPSRRFGFWDDEQPGGGWLALSFDFAVRIEALEKRYEAQKASMSGAPAPGAKSPAVGLREVVASLPSDSPLKARLEGMLNRD